MAGIRDRVGAMAWIGYGVELVLEVGFELGTDWI